MASVSVTENSPTWLHRSRLARTFLGHLSFILMAFNGVFFTKRFKAKLFENSRINRMCISHIMTVRGLLGSEGLPRSVWGFLATLKHPWYALYPINVKYTQSTTDYSDDVVFRLASSEPFRAALCHFFSCVSPPLFETSNLQPP